MWYLPVAQPALAAGPLGACYPNELLPRLSDALAELADVESRHDRERDDLHALMAPGAERERLAAELERRHAAEREPYMRRLDELQNRIPCRAP